VARTENFNSTTAPHSLSYNAEDLIDDLDAVRDVYTHLGRGRFAIYDYWEAAYRLRRKWRRLQRSGVKLKKVARRAIKGKVPSSSGDDLLRLIIDSTIITAAKSPMAGIALSKRKSKYFSLLNFAYNKGVRTDDLIEFVDRVGGLNYNRRSTTKGSRP
jgi:hypothetical protein